MHVNFLVWVLGSDPLLPWFPLAAPDEQKAGGANHTKKQHSATLTRCSGISEGFQALGVDAHGTRTIR